MDKNDLKTWHCGDYTIHRNSEGKWMPIYKGAPISHEGMLLAGTVEQAIAVCEDGPHVEERK